MVEEPVTIQTQTTSQPSVIDFESPTLKFKSLDSYSWSEEEWKVKIFIDFPDANKLTDQQIHLKESVDELDLRIYQNGEYYRFYIDALFDRVETMTLKRKKDSIVIAMKKQRERIWYKIKFD